MARSASARRSTATPRAVAALTSTLVGGIALDTITASSDGGRFAASWPTRASTPRSRRRSSSRDALRSDPLTWWPIRERTAAIALIPAPPIPTMCSARGVDRSRSATTGYLLHEVGEPRRSIGTADRERRHAHAIEPVRIGEQRVELATEPGRVELTIVHEHRRTRG